MLWILLPLLCPLASVPAVAVSVGSSVAGTFAQAPDPERFLADARLERDRLDPARLHALAELGTPAAAQALVDSYELFGSVFLRREVVLALQTFDGVAQAEQLALQKIADVATGAEEPELHRAAVDALGRSPSLGKHFLRLIVDSPAEAAVRVRALERHVALRGEGDDGWYEELFEAGGAASRRKGQAGRGERRRAVHGLMALRERALEAIAPELKASKLVDLAREKIRRPEETPLVGVRRIALSELGRRGDKKLAKLASTVYRDTAEYPENRVLAARLLYAIKGVKLAGEYVEAGTQNPGLTPSQLRDALADMVAEMIAAGAPTRTTKEILRRATKGGVVERLFALRALKVVPDPKQLETLIELTLEWLPEEPNSSLRIEMAGWLAAQGVAAAEPLLRDQLASTDEPAVATSALRALGELAQFSDAWRGELVELSGAARLEVRNAALRELQRVEDERWTELAFTALGHAHWSTRLVALELLEAQRSGRLVGALVERLDAEDGRVQDAFYAALGRLTGQSFRTAPAWSRWWKDQPDDYAPIDLETMQELEEAEAQRRLMLSSAAPTFFGIRVISKRVVFVVDVSGSMEIKLPPDFEDEPGESRFAVMRSSLSRCLEQLAPDSLFNVLAFAGGVGRWREGGISAADDAAKAAALAYVDKLRPGGGTNLYGALSTAFSDPDVDTIFLLSDGEPSQGRIVDPYAIRRRIQRWNEDRGVVIHTVSIGSDLAILRWLAEDSGGDHLRFE